MLYTEDFTMCHYVGFPQIGSQFSKIFNKLSITNFNTPCCSCSYLANNLKVFPTHYEYDKIIVTKFSVALYHKFVILLKGYTGIKV